MRSAERYRSVDDVVRNVGPVTPAMLDYLGIPQARPLSLDTFFRLQTADAARRLDVFEQQLQRRRLVAEHLAVVVARRLANWDLVEAASPYRSKEVH